MTRRPLFRVMGNRHPMTREAEERADELGATVWIVEPSHGPPYIAFNPHQIAPNYRGIWPVSPVTTASLR